MDTKKKTAAAISAVIAYLQEETAAFQPPTEAASPAQSAPAPVSAPPPAAPAGLWGVSGRQAQMQLRNLMQLRAIHRI